MHLGLYFQRDARFQVLTNLSSPIADAPQKALITLCKSSQHLWSQWQCCHSNSPKELCWPLRCWKTIYLFCTTQVLWSNTTAQSYSTWHICCQVSLLLQSFSKASSPITSSLLLLVERKTGSIITECLTLQECYTNSRAETDVATSCWRSSLPLKLLFFNAVLKTFLLED